MSLSRQKDDFSKIEKRLFISYGMLIFLVLGVTFISAVTYFNYVISKEQSRLASVIANSIGDSINRVSFSGKYQTRLLIEELASKNRNIDSIIIQNMSGEVIAHSTKENNGAIIIDNYFKNAKNVVYTGDYKIQTITVTRDGRDIQLLEIDMPFKKGYESEVFGVIRVLLSTDILTSFINEGIIYFSILIIALTLASIAIIRILSAKIGAPVRNMASQLGGILEYAPMAIYIMDKNREIIASSSMYDTMEELLKNDRRKELEERVFSRGTIETYDFTVITPQKDRHFHATKCPIAKDEFGNISLICTIALDITEQKEREKKIEALLEEQTAFFQNAVAGIIHLKGRRFVRSNDAWNNMLGYSPGELDGKDSKIIYGSEKEYQKLSKEAYKTMLEKGQYTTEQVLRKKDGSSIIALLSGAYIDRENPQKGSIWVGIDITQRKKAEEDLLLINKTLEQTVEYEIKKRMEAEQMAMQQSKMALMGEMIGAIAHQWRQPLNALGIAIQDIKEAYKYNEINEKYINDLVVSSMDRINFMSKTIDNFRNFFSPNKSKTSFFIEEAIEGVINIIGAQLVNNDITLNYNPGNKIEFYGYKNELQQVLLNIVSNAKDAIIENKSTIRYINISTLETDYEIYITIEDSGGGIPSHIINRICEPYFTTKEQGKGTGIGLYMSKQIIERHMNGELTYENGEYGAKFTIKLPKSI